MKLTINGEQMHLEDGTSVTGYLQQEKYHPDIVVVELNERIIPKEEHESTILQEGDILEIVTFMGGG